MSIKNEITRLQTAKSDLKVAINDIGGGITTETIDKYADMLVNRKIIIEAYPSQSGTLLYNGSDQSPTWINYDTTRMTIGGVTAATNAGTYTATFTPNDGYCWQHGVISAYEVQWSISLKSIGAVPSQTNTLTYNGETQSPVWSNTDENITFSGVTSSADAGSHTVTVTPNSGCCWDDGTTDSHDVVWTIGRQAISTVPAQSGALTYTGSAQTPSWNNYNSGKLTISGDTSATNAGDYTVTFTPTSNYKWSDGSTDAKSVTWSIDKETAYLEADVETVALSDSATSATVTISYNGDGTLSVSSSDTSVAAVSLSGKTLTITKGSATSGSATITISATGNTNYTDVDNEVITASISSVSSTLDDNSWEAISNVCQTGNPSTIWNVGDYKTITLSGTCLNQSLSGSYRVFILGFDHNMAIENPDRYTANQHTIHFGCFKTTSGQDIAIGNSKTYPYVTSEYYGLSTTTYFNMCGDNTTSGNSTRGTNYLGWKNTFMRHTILGSSNKAWSSVKNSTSADFNAPTDSATNPASNTLMSCLPSDLRAVMQPIMKYTDNIGQAKNTNDGVTQVRDYLPLLAEYEVFGSRSYANQYEYKDSSGNMRQQQYAYYSDSGNTKIKQLQNKSSSCYWWLRSPGYNYSYRFCGVTTSGYAVSDNAYVSYGVSALFSI